MKEIWRDVIYPSGFEGRYKVSNLGNVKSLFENHNMSPIKNHKGYYQICLFKNYKRKNIFIHRLVALNFIKNTQSKPYINHINTIKQDNRVENLEWCTYEENMKHAKECGIKFGRPKGFISERRKKVLLKDLENNPLLIFDSILEIVEMYGGSYSHISKCCNNTIKNAYGYKWEYINEMSI